MPERDSRQQTVDNTQQTTARGIVVTRLSPALVVTLLLHCCCTVVTLSLSSLQTLQEIVMIHDCCSGPCLSKTAGTCMCCSGPDYPRRGAERTKFSKFINNALSLIARLT
jgi:hypothetical protein